MTVGREETVGFVGLGMMGRPMAENILKEGHALVVYDLDPERVQALVEQGAAPASSLADLASRASRVVTMVDTTAQTEGVIFGEGGLLAGSAPGDVVVSMSTLDPAALPGMQARLDPHGVQLLDAAVSGMAKGAREGTLKAFVGGAPAALERCLPVLQAMTSEIIHFGPVGAGTTMKLVNNLLIQVQWAVIGEAFALGEKAGLDPKQMVEAVSGATGNSTAFQYIAPRILSGDTDGIRLSMTVKDLALQTSLGKALDVPMPLTALALQMYQMANPAGLGGVDGAVAIKRVYEGLAGLGSESPGPAE